MKKLTATLALIAILCLPGAASADLISMADLNFSIISGSSAYSTQVNMGVQVSQVSEHQVLLDFQNLSSTNATISQIYLQDLGGLMSSFELQNTGDISFREGAKPAYLPGGKPYNFDSTFSFGAQNPSPKWGVQANESYQILVNLSPDVVAAEFLTGLQNNTVQLGMHVQALKDGASLSMISDTPDGPSAAVPEPSTLILAGTALAGFAGLRWRRRRKDLAA